MKTELGNKYTPRSDEDRPNAEHRREAKTDLRKDFTLKQNYLDCMLSYALCTFGMTGGH